MLSAESTHCSTSRIILGIFNWHVNAWLLTLSGGFPKLTIRGGGQKCPATYFSHISSMEARILMKFKTYVHKILVDQQPNFHMDQCKDAHAKGENTCTYDALQRFRSESTKIEKMRFSAIFE